MFRSTGVMNTPAGGSNSLTDKLSEYKWTIFGVIALIPLFLLGNINMAILAGIGVIGGVVLHFLSRSNR